MKKHTLLAWVLAVVMTGSSAAAFPAVAADAKSTEPAADWIEGEAIVLTSGMPLLQGDTAGTEDMVVHTATFDLQPKTNMAEFPLLKSAVAAADSISVSLVRSETETTEELIARLKQQSNVVYAEPNWKIETCSITDYQDSLWALENIGQNNGTPDLDMHVEALDGTLTDTESVIAIVDTGINLSHPDLQPYLWENPYAESGELEGLHGYDYVNWDDDPTDDNGHGTHCAGIISSVLEQASVDNVKIMALKILGDDGNCGIYSEIAAYQYIYDAQSLGVNVTAINNSWGGPLFGIGSYGDIMNLVITLVGQNGALSICASGNDGSNVDNLIDYPSGLDNPYIISVAATDENDDLASFSNYGMKSVDLAAPGVNILSTYYAPNFEPSIFTEAQKEEWIALSEDFSATMPAWGDASSLSDGIGQGQLMLAWEEQTGQSLFLSQDVFFGTPDQASSLCWEYTIPEDGAEGALYLPLPYAVTEEERRDFCIRFRVETEGTECSLTVAQNTLTEDGTYGELETEWVLGSREYEADQMGGWNTVISDISGIDGEEHALVWRLNGLVPGGKVRIYLDDFNISTVNDGSDYPQYTYMNGTSMATPYVTAAAGLLALRNPGAGALEIATDLLCSTRPAEQLNGLVKTGGVLDLSQLESDRPRVLDSSLNTETGELTLTGCNLNHITNYSYDAFTDVQTISCTDTEMVLDVSDYERCFLNMTFYDENDNTVYQITQYYPSGTLPEIVSSVPEQAENSFDNRTFCINNNFYSYDVDGWLFMLDMTDGWSLLDSSGFPVIDDTVPDAANLYTVSDHQLYVMAVYPLSGGTTKRVLCYDFEQGSWTDCGFPEELNEGTIKFAAGDGMLWFIGEQYDAETGTDRFVVCEYNPDTQETVHISEMPFYRMEMNCYWIADQLVLSMDNLPDLITDAPLPQAIYDPSTDSWEICEQMTFEQMQTMYYGTEYYLYPFVNAANSRYLVYVGMGVQGAGDIILYDVQTNQYLSTEYSIYDVSQQYYCQVAANEEMLYLIFADETKLGQPYSSVLDLQIRGVSFEELAASATPIIKLGDADEDGSITVEDATAILTAYAKNSAALESNLTSSQKRLSDVNKDGSIGIEDATSVLTYYARKCAGLDASF
ncbi:MAG: S8 family serine peptidase [Ruminococcus sp.]